MRSIPNTVTAIPKLRRYAVADKRYSASTFPLEVYDWSNWWIDLSFGGLYLHVQHEDQDRVGRIYCKKAKLPRITMVKGVLHWLVEDGAPKWERAK